MPPSPPPDAGTAWARGPGWAANEVLAFLLELAALAALCYWGFATGAGVAVRLLLGLGAPLAAAVVWGLFAAPRARFRLPLPAVLAVKALVFAAATAALAATGHPIPAVAFAVLSTANTALAKTGRRRPTP